MLLPSGLHGYAGEVVRVKEIIMLQGWIESRTLFKSQGSCFCLWADDHSFLSRDFFLCSIKSNYVLNTHWFNSHACLHW